MKPINGDTIKEWIAALRSGEYKQGRNGFLRSSDDMYCCLGVLCEIRGATWEDAPLETVKTFSGSAGYVSVDDREVLMTYGLDTLHLMEMNDHAGDPFTKIADYIEETYSDPS